MELTTIYVCPSRHYNNTREEGLTENDVKWYIAQELEIGPVMRATRLSLDEGESKASNCKSMLKYEDMWEAEVMCDPREQGTIFNIPVSLALPSDRKQEHVSIFDVREIPTANTI